MVLIKSQVWNFATNSTKKKMFSKIIISLLVRPLWIDQFFFASQLIRRYEVEKRKKNSF